MTRRNRAPSPAATVLLGLLAAFAAARPTEAEAVDGPPTLDDVKAGLQARRDRLRSLSVEYVVRIVPLVEPARVAAMGGPELMAVETVRSAIKGRRVYQQSILEQGGQPAPKRGANAGAGEQPRPVGAGGDAERDRQRQEAIRAAGGDEGAVILPGELSRAFDGEHGEGWTHASAQPFFMKRRADEPGAVSITEFSTYGYLGTIGIGLPGREGRKAVDPNSLPEALTSGAYRVSKETERIGDAECLVVEGKISRPGGYEVSERLWLDPKRGFALLRRDVTDPAGRHSYRLACSEFEEAVKGCWLPRACRVEFLAPATAAPDVRGKPFFAHVIRVIKWSTDDIKDDLFEIPARAKVVDPEGAVGAPVDK